MGGVLPRVCDVHVCSSRMQASQCTSSSHVLISPQKDDHVLA